MSDPSTMLKMLATMQGKTLEEKSFENFQVGWLDYYLYKNPERRYSQIWLGSKCFHQLTTLEEFLECFHPNSNYTTLQMGYLGDLELSKTRLQIWTDVYLDPDQHIFNSEFFYLLYEEELTFPE